MNKEKTLFKTVWSDTGTIAIMDKYEERNDKNEKIYDTLCLEDFFSICTSVNHFKTSLLIKRTSLKDECIPCTLTFTDIKKLLLRRVYGDYNLDRYKESKRYILLSEIYKCAEKIQNSDNKEPITCYFDTPIQFNAQNSSNRTGYGNYYVGEDLVYEGTLYGETTRYAFVGVILKRW